MLEIIKQLALDVAEQGSDFCIGIVTETEPLKIRLEEGLELTTEFLVQMENTLEWTENGRICMDGGEWRDYRAIHNRRLLKGEAVSMLRAADGQQYLVLGRVREEGIV
jgi:hypothetical protein